MSKYPFECFPWNDDDETTWVDGDDAKRAYDKVCAERDRLLADLKNLLLMHGKSFVCSCCCHDIAQQALKKEGE